MEFLCGRQDGDRRRHDAALLGLVANNLQRLNEYVMDVNTCWRSLGREVHRKMLMPLVYKYAMCPYTPDFCAACAVEAEAKVAAYCDEWDVRVTELLNGGQDTRVCNGGCLNIEGVARVLDHVFAICKVQEQGQGTFAGLQIFFLLAALPK
eukprot:906346-Rhodomonas_salina.1